jgi:hypothetical protein
MPRIAEKAVQMYQRMVTEAVSERCLVTAVSMSEMSGIELLPQRESYNAEEFAAFFSGKARLRKPGYSSWR